MLKFCNLFSGSSGNCSYVESDNAKVLIDCGASCKRTIEALASLNVDASELDGILITHEHQDHVNGLSVLCKKYNVPVYINKKTFLGLKKPIPEGCNRFFTTDSKFEVNDLEVIPFSIPHDAADPCGFSISCDGKKICVATDIGHFTNNIYQNLEGSDFLLLESNYEPEMLKCSKYPYLLKRRILGPNGHLSNDDAGEALSSLVKSGVENVMLGHLSQQNNFPELAYKTVVDSLISNHVDSDRISLSVASRLSPDKLMPIA